MASKNGTGKKMTPKNIKMDMKCPSKQPIKKDKKKMKGYK